MDSNGEFVDIIRSYDDFMPYCKFLKEERFDTRFLSMVLFIVNDKKGTIKAEGQRPMGGSRLSRFSQKFKLHRNVYNTKDIHARFGNDNEIFTQNFQHVVLTIRLPKWEPLMIPNFDDTSDLFVYNTKLFKLKISKRAILKSIAIVVVVGVAIGGYVTSGGST
ncbi:unnamed protein product [Malus baccata var. baccata]